MQISISNIAWDVSEDASVAEVLAREGIEWIDIAPGKYFPEPGKATAAQIEAVAQWWRSRGIRLAGMQALLFGTQGLNVFGTAASREAMLAHLRAVCVIAGALGASRLVFGSPRNRDRTEIGNHEVHGIAADFFGRLGDIAAQYGVRVCLEPNPPRYGCNFLTTSLDALAFVDSLAHPAIFMQLDTGTMAINGEDPVATVERCRHVVGHIHASEPDLVPLGDAGTDHEAISAVVRRVLGDHLVTIEMVATTTEPHLESIRRAVRRAQQWYGPAGLEKGTTS